MKVLYIHSSAVPSKRANSAHVVAMVGQLVQMGSQVTCLLPKLGDLTLSSTFSNLIENSQIDVYESRSKVWFLPSRARHLFGSMLNAYSNKYDVIVTRFVVLFPFLCFVRNRTVIDLHMLPRDMGRLVEVIFRLGLYLPKNKRIKLFAVSDQLRTAYYENYGKKYLIEVAHDGAFKSNFQGADDDCEGLHVGYVGSLTRGKGFELVVNIANSFPAVTFDVYGNKDDIDFNFVGSSNLLMHGFIDNGRVAEIMSGFHIFLNPSQRKMSTYGSEADISQYNSPLKIFEAMAAGLPILTSDFPNIREVLDESEAVFVSADDIKGWCNALKKLIDSVEYRKSLGRNARAKLIKCYTWQARCEKFLGLETA
jgi:glycosyltransferase involved in cell wall biosynthesis